MYMKFEKSKILFKISFMHLYEEQKKKPRIPPPPIKNPTDWHLTLQLVFNQHKQEKR